jgi:hypothetical protein
MSKINIFFCYKYKYLYRYLNESTVLEVFKKGFCTDMKLDNAIIMRFIAVIGDTKQRQ